MVAARVKTAPSAIVMMLSAFWSLVPGALSFESVSQAASGGNIGVSSLGATGAQPILPIRAGHGGRVGVFPHHRCPVAAGRRDWPNQPYGNSPAWSN